jgi:copper chaperone CopZ
MKNILVLLLFMLSSTFVRGEFLSAEIGVDGLTCSQCSRSVEMKLRALDFVADVQMNLEQNIGLVTFKKGKVIRLERLGKAVIDAGFSVGYIRALFDFSDTNITSDGSFSYEGLIYQPVNDKPTTLPAVAKIQLVGDDFMDTASWKKWKSEVKHLQQKITSEPLFVLWIE